MKVGRILTWASLSLSLACAGSTGEGLDGTPHEGGAAAGGSTSADGGGETEAGGGGSLPGGGGGAGSSSSGGSGGSPSAPPVDCSSYPYDTDALLAERLGYGAETTGGDPDNVYHVTTLAGSGSGSLKSALESSEDYWIVFDVEGWIELGGGVANIVSHKTIDGRGRDITIEGTLEIEDERDIIISDVRLTNSLEDKCTQDGDVVVAKGTGSSPNSYTTRDLWLHHVELFDGGDGLFDLRGASKVTLSWSHLHTHKKAMLMWKQADQSAAPGMRVTLHHNFLDRLSLRGPQFVFGKIHYLNNYQFEWYEYGAGSLGGAQMYSEGNIYQARPGNYCLTCPDPNPCGDHDYAVSKEALVTEWGGNGTGKAKSVDDLALNDAVISQNGAGDVFDPGADYDYDADTATPALADTIAANAGPRPDYCQP